MNSIIESQESLSDFKKSINLVSNNIEEICSSKVYLSHKLKINVDEDYEVILTHYPLWNNEPFLYMICDKHSKNIIEKEKMLVMYSERIEELENKENKEK